MRRTAPPLAQVQPITRCLAEMQTSIVSAGIRAFDGWLDRFIIYTLLARVNGLVSAPVEASISIHAAAESLGKPYESVRRHVHVMIEQGLIARQGRGLRVRRSKLAHGTLADLLRLTHDSFVRFIEDLASTGETLPLRRHGVPYHFTTGARAAVDILLAITQTNRGTHDGWIDLVLFSTVVAANCRPDPIDDEPDVAQMPVSAAAITRALAFSPTTTARRLSAMVRSSQLIRAGSGYRVNPAWLSHPDARAVTAHSLENVRRLLNTVAAQGFPFDDPASAYLDERPPWTPIG
ncbi:hypothetical protein [Sphingomonas sp.]|uniref:hypothetical protein n=1 Tax=Sphingomonas sp. TaxID=28214 RepID=UPI001EB44AC0|nr:hypothetical protein [Sphingomonas sp.]MBX3594994.1 hypothetical protein [Sphingomonas sp.]